MKEQSEPGVVDVGRIRDWVAAGPAETKDNDQTTCEGFTADPAPAKEPKSLSLNLAGAQPEEVLELRAWATSSGWRSEVVHRVGKKSTRGATAEHTNLEAARTALEQLAAKAEKDGWTRRPARGGFARKPDAFDPKNLPRPGKAKK